MLASDDFVTILTERGFSLFLQIQFSGFDRAGKIKEAETRNFFRSFLATRIMLSISQRVSGDRFVIDFFFGPKLEGSDTSVIVNPVIIDKSDTKAHCELENW